MSKQAADNQPDPSPVDHSTPPLVTNLTRGAPTKRQLPVGVIIAGVGFGTLAVLAVVFLLVARGRDTNRAALEEPLAGVALPDEQNGFPSEIQLSERDGFPTEAPDAHADVDVPLRTFPSPDVAPPLDVSQAASQADAATANRHAVNDDDRSSAIPATPIAHSMAMARTFIQRREVAVAGRTLDQAARLAERPEQFARIARLRMLNRWLTDFWAAWERNRGRTPVGYQLRAGDVSYTINEFSAARLTVTVDGNPSDLGLRDVPAALAAELAERRLTKDDPYSDLCLAAFWAVDPAGDVGRAAELLDGPRLAGLPIDALVAELERAGNGAVAIGSDSSETPTPLADPIGQEPSDAAPSDESAGGEQYAETLLVPLSGEVVLSMRLMPPGDFMMGPPGKETPARIDRPYYIGVTEVTQAQWAQITGVTPSHYQGDVNQPVDSVTWNDCQDFILLLNATPAGRKNRFRFPTEAEWEYALEFGSDSTYFFGEDLALFGRYGWSRETAEGRTHPVGELLPNAAGLFDMYGNVWEWTSERVIRGGGVGDTPRWSTLGAHSKPADESHRTWGLRLVCEP